MNKQKFFQMLIFFFATWAVLSFFTTKQNQNNTPQTQSDVVLTATKNKFSQGSIVEIKMTNNKAEALLPWSDCPAEPLDVYRWDNGNWLQITADASQYECNSTKVVQTGTSEVIDYGNWNYELFQQLGRYKVVYQDGEREFPAEFEVKSRNLFGQIWNGLFYKPIYNVLIFFVSVLPGHNLGWAIVLLTIVIKLILLGPNHKALKAQKALQKVQPELDKIKEKYKGDQQKIAQETMQVWKKHKVNPMGSCLPMLIQFPIMIALFYVVKVGLSPNNVHLLYAPLNHFDLTLINPIFLGILNLKEINTFFLPLIVGGLQFAQMKLTFALKNDKKPKKDASPQASQMQAMNKMMTYTLPVMLAFFTATMPAAVGIYWGVSTLFGIAQQFYINRK